MEAGAAQVVAVGAHQVDVDSSGEAREAVGAADQEVVAALADAGLVVEAHLEGEEASVVVEASADGVASVAHSQCLFRVSLSVLYVYHLLIALFLRWRCIQTRCSTGFGIDTRCKRVVLRCHMKSRLEGFQLSGNDLDAL